MRSKTALETLAAARKLADPNVTGGLVRMRADLYSDAKSTYEEDELYQRLGASSARIPAASTRGWTVTRGTAMCPTFQVYSFVPPWSRAMGS